MTPPPRPTGSTPGFGRGGVGKHTRLKTYPANPATGVEGGENRLPDGKTPAGLGTRHLPGKTRQRVLKGAGIPSLTGKTPAGLGTWLPPLLSGGVGWVSGDSPDKGFCDGEGHKPLLEGGLSGLSGRFSGVCCPLPLPAPCWASYPAPILPMRMGANPSSGGELAGYCRVPAGWGTRRGFCRWRWAKTPS